MFIGEVSVPVADKNNYLLIKHFSVVGQINADHYLNELLKIRYFQSFYFYIFPTAYTLSIDGSKNYSSGALEINFLNISGRICADGWDNKDAVVACRELGYSLGNLPLSFLYEPVIMVFLVEFVCIIKVHIFSCQKSILF